jgi:hypothetical protein
MVEKEKTSEEYDRFNDLMGNLLKVPHSELKEKLDEEKKEKKRKREVTTKEDDQQGKK